ncbi:MAG: ABC transporter ATP-binding protein, partial [Anaerolineales bacterium]|nr:ABC transporter ATP-binding protein [Anaerolineales bacterium]
MTPASAQPMLEVKNLRIRFTSYGHVTEAVRGVSFDMGREKLGIVGESGSGKSQTARAVLKLVHPAATMSADRLRFDDIDLMAQSEADMLAIRG